MIGNSISSFGTQLPTQIEVLQLCYNLSPKLPEANKISTVVRLIEEKYRENDLRIKGTETIRLKLRRLVASCKKFVSKRTNCRHSIAERMRQGTFHKNIHNLFEITSNLVQLNINQSEIQNPDDSDDPDDPDDSDSDYIPSEDDFERSPKGKLPISDAILSRVSQTKASYRMCESLLQLGCEIPGASPNNYQLSKSTLWEKITKLRSNKKRDMLASLEASDCKVVIQFDGKTYPKLNERHIGFNERLIVLCHTTNGDIPLGLFILNSHSGFDCATPVINAIKDNNLKHRLIGFGCDTENVNVGRWTGACVQIERQLEMEVLHLMCRHHCFELILKSVFHKMFGETTGPRVTTFDILNKN